VVTTRIQGIVALLACVGILALGWFFGGAPQLAARSASEQQTVVVDAQNAVHRARLAVLKEQFARLDETRAALAQLRTGLPDTISGPNFVDEVYAAAASHGLAVTAYAATEATAPIAAAAPVVPVEPAAVPATTTAATAGGAPAAPVIEAAAVTLADTAATPGVTPPAPGTPADTSLLTPDTFYAIPVSFTLGGKMADIHVAIAALQGGPRLFLATSAVLETDTDPAKSTAEVSGYVYVVPTQDLVN
jgi:hypothetical protein